ncbi:MAG TPA: DUF4199 domain-containing protein [Puia sp.]|nr:DUF4199 domain-containing protein [Puia sp.]
MTQRKPISVFLLYGGIAALGMILVTFGTYKAGVEAFLSLVNWLMYLIPVSFGIIAALVERRRGGGYLEFRSALRIIFGILVLATALQGLFTWLLLSVFDPHFGQLVHPVWLAKTEAAFRRVGVTGDQLDKSIAALKDSNPFSLGAVLFGLAKFYMLGFPVSILLAAIIKRKKPLERQTTL